MILSGDRLAIWSGFIDDGVVRSMFLLNKSLLLDKK